MKFHIDFKYFYIHVAGISDRVA